MAETEEWRLFGHLDFLKGATLQWKAYEAWSETWEHDHCRLCSVTFDEIEENPDSIRWGYAAQGTGPEGEDDYHWICERCFGDFKERFGWRVEPASSNPPKSLESN